LVLFLAFCGGAALFAGPLLLGALVLGARSDPIGPATGPASERPSQSPVASAEPITDEIVGSLSFRAFDLGFEPTNVEVEQPGRYEITFLNDGAIPHDITFADGTVLPAEPGETVTGEVVVPSAGLGFICSIPGHADGGMQGSILVAGSNPILRTNDGYRLSSVPSFAPMSTTMSPWDRSTRATAPSTTSFNDATMDGLSPERYQY